jgi:alanine racemase
MSPLRKGVLTPIGGRSGTSARSDGQDDYGSCDPWLEISLKNIEFNLGQLRKKILGRPILAVVKCNAYGHGLEAVGKFLEGLPVYGLAVGRLNEAIILRKAGIKCPILNFGPFSRADAETIVRGKISQSVYTGAVSSLNEWARKLGIRAGVHIKIDTGLGRVGIPHPEACAYIRSVARLKNVKIEGVFQTFSEDKEFDLIQLRRFVEVTDRARQEGIAIGFRHASSSAGIFSYSESFYLDMVRPGISIYGLYPTHEEYRLKRLELRPALTLKTRVAFVKKLNPGDFISYHRKFVAKRAEFVATASLGYPDGVPMNLADHAFGLVRGKKFPMFCDLTANHGYLRTNGGPEIRIGDEIVIIGKQGNQEITIEDLSRAVGLSDYKILMCLNPNLKRVYLS